MKLLGKRDKRGRPRACLADKFMLLGKTN